jgi:hypothetical protein
MDDYRAVCEVVYTFAEGLDSRDWQLYRSVFTSEIEIDYSFFHAGQKGTVSADDWVSNVERRLSRLDATQHSMSNPRTRLSGTQAECTMYVQAQHVVAIDGAKAWCTVGGQYTFRLVRGADRWLIRSVALMGRWITGDERVLAVARE